MPTSQPPASDAPEKLKAISDHQRAETIAQAISDAAGWNVKVEMTSSSYRGYVHPRGPFRQPTRLTFELRLLDVDPLESPDAAINALRRVSDEELSEAIARRLGKVAGQNYVAEISDRRYASGKAKRSIARVSVLVALRESET
jgi:hypothetical protein